MKSLISIPVWLVLSTGCLLAQSGVVDKFHDLQDRLDSAVLDTYDGIATTQTSQDLATSWAALSEKLTDPTSRSLVPHDFAFTTSINLAAKIGLSRAALQQIAALEMLANQRAGHVTEAQAWRDVVTLPQFANADEGGLLLQQPSDQVSQTAVSSALSKEYVGWQVTRCRQLLDALANTMATGEANDAYVQAKLWEIKTLAEFPEVILQQAGVDKGLSASAIALPKVPEPLNSPDALASLSCWREKLETTLPNLLSASDVTRLSRLLARFVIVIPKEYRNGVQAGAVVIPLEYKEALQFTQQAQSLVNELAPVWRRDQASAFSQYHEEVLKKLGVLKEQIGQIVDVSVIEATAGDIGSILENRFGVTARRSGDKGQIIEETALDVRDALNNSLAAARLGHWQEAESLRLDAYTSFDSEIEIRVMPRDPTLAIQTERSFLDGQEQPGIKALLDSGAPMDQLTDGYARALRNLDECVALLKVSVSPGTIAFTAFTILAREGLEAIVILAALLAGLRGAENIKTRRGIVQGAILGVCASGLTFWLSQTVVHSLVRYGEKLEAVISVFAVIILFIVTNWVFHKFYWSDWNARLRDLSKTAKAVRAPVWEFMALLGVGFLTVYREGFETTIFMQSLILEGSTVSVLAGILSGLLFIGTIGVLILFFGAKLPYRKLLIVTGLLVVSIMTTFLGSGVRLFQTVGWLPVHPLPGLNIPNWVGVWFGIYPSWEGLLIPPLALVYVGGAWLYVKISARLDSKHPVHARPQVSVSQSSSPVSA